jgi:hypothetical protein
MDDIKMELTEMGYKMWSGQSPMANAAKNLRVSKEAEGLLTTFSRMALLHAARQWVTLLS